MAGAVPPAELPEGALTTLVPEGTHRWVDLDLRHCRMGMGRTGMGTVNNTAGQVQVRFRARRRGRDRGTPVVLLADTAPEGTSDMTDAQVLAHRRRAINLIGINFNRNSQINSKRVQVNSHLPNLHRRSNTLIPLLHCPMVPLI